MNQPEVVRKKKKKNKKNKKQMSLEPMPATARDTCFEVAEQVLDHFSGCIAQ